MDSLPYDPERLEIALLATGDLSANAIPSAKLLCWGLRVLEARGTDPLTQIARLRTKPPREWWPCLRGQIEAERLVWLTLERERAIVGLTPQEIAERLVRAAPLIVGAAERAAVNAALDLEGLDRSERVRQERDLRARLAECELLLEKLRQEGALWWSGFAA